MTIYSVYDPAFKPYGRIVTGLEEATAEILEVMKTIPVPTATAYVPVDPRLQVLPAKTVISNHLYGGMPIQLGWCGGHNTRLDCLEYHRDSEFNLSPEDYIVLLAKQHEIENGVLDTAKVKAFRIPAGVMVECYATTLHYTPCHADPEKGFRMLVALPWGTNTEKPEITPKTWEDGLLMGQNKWVLAHKDAPEAAQGAYIGLVGENYDLGEKKK